MEIKTCEEYVLAELEYSKLIRDILKEENDALRKIIKESFVKKTFDFNGETYYEVNEGKYFIDRDKEYQYIEDIIEGE